MVAFTVPEAEQARDRALFAEAGVSETFLETMFREDAGGMWFPSAAELRTANVVTALLSTYVWREDPYSSLFFWICFIAIFRLTTIRWNACTS